MKVQATEFSSKTWLSLRIPTSKYFTLSTLFFAVKASLTWTGSGDESIQKVDKKGNCRWGEKKWLTHHHHVVVVRRQRRVATLLLHMHDDNVGYLCSAACCCWRCWPERHSSSKKEKALSCFVISPLHNNGSSRRATNAQSNFWPFHC